MIHQLFKHKPQCFIFFIGHRGTGKSTFAKKCAEVFPSIPVIDLDTRIEQVTQMSIVEIFRQKGEGYFRTLEHSCLADTLREYQNQGAIIVLGAGFGLESFSSWPKHSYFFWIRRVTDRWGRVFLNRPSLNNLNNIINNTLNKSNPLADTAPLQEYFEHFERRQTVYQKFADIIFELPEGFEFNDWREMKNPSLRGSIVTLTPWFFQKSQRMDILLLLNPQLIEIRTDLVSQREGMRFMTQLPQRSLLLAVRSACWDLTELPISPLWDVDISFLSLLPKKIDRIFIISSHDQKPPDSLYLKKANLLKWSPLIKNWTQVDEALSWQKQNPKQHILAPRIDPNWQSNEDASWLRLLLLLKQKWHYLRCDVEGSHPQQLPWIQYIHWRSVIGNNVPLKTPWRAVLGYPIVHSYSPEFHRYLKYPKPFLFLKIPVPKQEWSEAISVLKRHNLGAAAITSPLKQELNPSVPINTMRLSPRSSNIQVTNTDILGLYELLLFLSSLDPQKPVHLNEIELLKTLKKKYHRVTHNFFSKEIKPHQNVLALSRECLIFGGGGMLPILKKLLPEGDHIPARNTPCDTVKVTDKSYRFLFWAARPDASFHQLKDLSIGNVIDLNYQEWSHARILAKQKQIPYVSGRLLFVAQAYFQKFFFT
ncbi:MAG: hypothetical protein NZ480_00355 [Bdellovibrionaceae bacterium]|nr:hypothetical protein [Pseudobdellovibrionaceae bacterium]MDW8190142.1 shikimate kinase [Pseudobdellovibrionaceae bacterium]